MNLFSKKVIYALLALSLIYCMGIAGADTTIQMPDGLRVIEEEAFMETAFEDDVVIPEGVISIGDRAFANSAIKAIYLPETIQYIGENVFAGVSDYYAVVEPGSYAEAYCGQSGIPTRTTGGYPESEHPYNQCDTVTYEYIHPLNAAYLRITFDPETFIAYANYIRITDSQGNITKYYDSELAGKDIYLPGNRFTISLVADDPSMQELADYYGFAITKITGLTEAEYNAPYYYMEDGIITGYSSATERSELEIPATVRGHKVIGIGVGAFWKHREINRITLPEGLTSIGVSAFNGCTGLTEITLPQSLNSIGDGSFSDCSGLAEITLPQSVNSIGVRAFSNCSGLATIHLPDGLNTIPKGLCQNCTGLRTIHLPESTQQIGEAAFQGCSGLTEITIPGQVTSIGSSAFSGCTGLTEITLPEGLTSIGGSAFSRCTGLTEIHLPESLTSIGSSAFSGCSGLTAIHIPANVTSIGNSAFAGCSRLKTIYVSENNSVYASVDGVLFNKGKTDIIICPSGLEGVFHVPETMTAIGDYVFDGCAGLTGIRIPESVTSIGRYAFRSCTGLTDIDIPGSVTTIGGYAFQNCRGLTSVNLADSIRVIGEYAFQQCTGLTSIRIPNGVTEIERGLFDGCSGLSDVSIPSSVTRIGNSAFHNCSGMTGIHIPNSVEDIGESAFSGCGLSSIRIPQGVTYIAWGTFEWCGGLTSVTLPSGVTGIDSSAFAWCSSLQQITIPNGVAFIGQYAFENCEALSDIRLPGSLRFIGDCAFARCRSLGSITIPEGVTEMGNYCFSECPGISRILIPDSLKIWGDYSFSYENTYWNEYHPTIYGGQSAYSFASGHGCPYAETVNAEDYILSISRGSNGEKSVFFTPFGGGGYELYGADSIDGTYQPIAWEGNSGIEGCRVIDWRGGSNQYYRILSYNSWTTPFRAEDYGMKFRTEEANGTIRILGIYSRDTISEIEIPKTIDGKTVSGIAEDAFASFTRMDRISLPYELREYLSILIRPNPETRILIRDDGHIVIAGDVIKSIARSSSGPVYSIFFQGFEAGKEIYTLLASEQIDGEYREVTRSGATLFDCRVIVYGAEDAETRYYRIQGENLWTSPFRMSDYGMTFRTETAEGGLRIIGVYSGNTITEIQIPQNIDGIPVTEIGQNAFASYTNLDLIVLPDGLMTWKDQMNVPSGTSVISATERALFDQIYRTDEEWAPCSTNAGKHYLKSYKMHFESTTYPALNRVRTICISEGDAEKKDHEYDIEGTAFETGSDHYTFLHYAKATFAKCSVCGKEIRGTENDFYKAEVRGLHCFDEDGRCTECGHEEDEADRYYQAVIPTILSGGNPVNAVAEIIRNRMHDGGLSYYMADVVISKLNETDDSTMRDNFLLSFFLYDIDTANNPGKSQYLHTNRTLTMTSQEYYNPVEVFFHEAGHAIQYNTIEKQSKNDNSVNVPQPSATLSPNYGLEYGIQNTLISEGREYIRNGIRNYSIDNVDYINALRHNIKQDLGTGDDSPLGRLLTNIFSDKNLTRNLEELILEIKVTGQTYYQQVDDFTLSDEELEQMVNLYVNSQIKESNELYWAPEALERNLHLKCLYSCVNKSITEKLCEREYSNADMLPEIISGITNNKIAGLDAHNVGYHYQNGVLKITLMRECFGEYVSGQLMDSGKDDENRTNFQGACGKMQQLSEAIKAYYLRYFVGE